MGEKARNEINIESLGFACFNSPVFAPNVLCHVACAGHKQPEKNVGHVSLGPTSDALTQGHWDGHCHKTLRCCILAQELTALLEEVPPLLRTKGISTFRAPALSPPGSLCPDSLTECSECWNLQQLRPQKEFTRTELPSQRVLPPHRFWIYGGSGAPPLPPRQLPGGRAA